MLALNLITSNGNILTLSLTMVRKEVLEFARLVSLIIYFAALELFFNKTILTNQSKGGGPGFYESLSFVTCLFYNNLMKRYSLIIYSEGEGPGVCKTLERGYLLCCIGTFLTKTRKE